MNTQGNTETFSTHFLLTLNNTEQMRMSGYNSLIVMRIDLISNEATLNASGIFMGRVWLV